ALGGPLPARGAARAGARRGERPLPVGARAAARHEHAETPAPPSAPAPPRVCDAPARGRRRLADDPGAARSQLPLDDADVLARRRAPPAARLRQITPALLSRRERP